MITRVLTQLRGTKLLVHFLVCVFAIASWANLNGMWVELPLLVVNAPEEWTLPSYITIISQVANIGPILFVLITYFLPQTKGKIEIYTSGGIIISSVVSSLLIAFFWDKTSYLAGEERSTALLSLNFFMAFGDCISSVSFYAFMSMMKPEYMTTLLIGEGLSGMLPAMMALGQGAGSIVCVNGSSTENATYPNGTEYNKTTWNVYPTYETPDFSVKVYFILLSCIIACSFIAFITLNLLPYCRTEFIDSSSSEHERIIQNKNGYDSDSRTSMMTYDNPMIDDEQRDTHAMSGVSKNGQIASDNEPIPVEQASDGIEMWKILCFQGIVMLVNMTLTSFLSMIQVYSTLPYGLDPYHLTTTLTQIANPVACIFCLVFLVKSLGCVAFITFLGQVGTAYIIYMASTSPDPPLHGDPAGGPVSVTVWVMITFLLVYAKTCVASVMRNYGRRYLIWTGVSTQLGSLIGAITGFVLVNVYDVFVSAPYC